MWILYLYTSDFFVVVKFIWPFFESILHVHVFGVVQILWFLCGLVQPSCGPRQFVTVICRSGKKKNRISRLSFWITSRHFRSNKLIQQYVYHNNLLVVLGRPFNGVVVQPSILCGEHVQLLSVTQATGRKIGIDFGEHYRYGRQSGGRLAGQIGTCMVMG